MIPARRAERGALDRPAGSGRLARAVRGGRLVRAAGSGRWARPARSGTPARAARRTRLGSRFDESGQVAGIEAIPFGLLVFVVGVLVVTNAWAVVDAKMAVASAAREATRAYVEAPPGSDPLAEAQAAAAEAVRGAGRDPGRLRVTPVEAGFSRCQRVQFEVAYPVPALTLPWIGSYGHGYTAAARYSEIVDPFRSGVPPAGARCDTAAP